jgi:hypothetical protein
MIKALREADIHLAKDSTVGKPAKSLEFPNSFPGYGPPVSETAMTCFEVPTSGVLQ